MSLNIDLLNSSDFFDLSDDLLCIIGPDLCFVKVNHTFRERLGYAEEDLIGKKIISFLHYDDLIIGKSILHSIQSGKPVTNFLNRCIHKNGTSIWLSWNGRKINNSQFIYASARDYTGYKEHEALLRRAIDEKEVAVERYKFATLATQDAIWDWDLLKDQIYWGGGFKKLFRHEGGLQGSDSWTAHIHPDDLERVLASIYGVINDPAKTTWQEEYRYQNLEGEYLYISDHGYVIRNAAGKGIRMVGAMQDITVLKKSEAELKRLSLIAKETSNAVIVTDTNGLTIWVNDAFTRISEYELNDMLGKTPGSVLQGAETNPETVAYLSDKIKNKEPFICDIINYSKSGHKYWMHIEGRPLLNENGIIEGFFALQTDITKEKQAAHEREMLISELSRNNADLKKFSYITSHNMRAPIANLMAIADLVDTSKFLDPGTMELFNGFKISTRHLSETLNDLIDILIIKENTSLQLSQVSFESVFASVTNSINTFLKDSETTIQTDFTAAPSVLFNSIYMESIFLNLITNSIKYAHPGRKPLISIRTIIKDARVQLIYTDNGIGFDLEKVKDRIFGLYQRFHHHAQSKGIGLYLVHSQVTALGGTIDIESELGNYSRFIITFKAR